MGKVIVAALFVAGLYAGLELHQYGVEGAFGGALAGLSRDSDPSDVLEDTFLYASPEPDGSGTERVTITDAVRQRMNAHVETGARRRRASASASDL